MVEVAYDNPDVVKFRLRFRGANSTPMKKIGLPVYDGHLSEDMHSPDFFVRFIADVSSSVGTTVTSEPSHFTNCEIMNEFRTIYSKFFISTSPVIYIAGFCLISVVLCLENNYNPESPRVPFKMESVKEIETGVLPKTALAVVLCPVYHFSAKHCRGNVLVVLKRQFQLASMFDEVVKLAFPKIESPRVRSLLGRNITKYLTSARQGTNLFYFLRLCIVGIMLKRSESDILNIACREVVEALLDWTQHGEETDDLKQENLVNCYTDSISVIDRRGFQLHYSHAFIERLNAAMCMGRR